MSYCVFLLCFLAAQTSCSSVAQRKVIENYVKSLDDIDLIDPKWQKILEKVAAKADVSQYKNMTNEKVNKILNSNLKSSKMLWFHYFWIVQTKLKFKHIH